MERAPKIRGVKVFRKILRFFFEGRKKFGENFGRNLGFPVIISTGKSEVVREGYGGLRGGFSSKISKCPKMV